MSSIEAKDISAWQLEQLRKELEEYQTEKRLNNDRQSDLKYYAQVLSCIHMKEVRRMKLDDIIQANNLMEKANDLLNQVHPFFEENEQQNICVTQYHNIIQKIYQ